MKKTFVTVMPNHIGAFLKASRCFAEYGVNITRVSYNKAVDSHMLFIDAEGTAAQLDKAAEGLRGIGYLQCDDDGRSVILMEFKLRDIPGSVTAVLELISEFSFNISYISSQENGSDYQEFKMGIVIDDSEKIKKFLDAAKNICDVRVIDYNHADKIYDNSLFYMHFVNELSSLMRISDDSREALLVNVNLAMQQLDDSGVSPYRTFDSISRFCELLSKARGADFAPRISKHKITDKTDIILIEPPCGSNTAIIKSGDEYLFADSGYAYCADEMRALFRELIPGFDGMKKRIFVTHADVDHCGLLPMFDEVLASCGTAECLKLEYENGNGYREQNTLHKPYVRMCKILTSYEPVNPEKIKIADSEKTGDGVLERTGFLNFGDLNFEIYCGGGGHLPGESVLIDYTNRVVFSGDIFVNLKDMTEQQAQYNRYAPILMTSVDTDPVLCARERQAIFARLGVGTWQIFGGHGGKKTYTVKTISEQS